MATSTLTSKGQITLPQVVRRTLGLEAGDKVDFVADAGGGFRLISLRQDVTVLRGRFAGRAAAPVSVEAMADAIEREAAESATRSARRRRRK